MERKHEKYQVWLPEGSVLVNEGERSPVMACQWLERGSILYFPRSPFVRSPADQAFLLNQQQNASALHKNISFRPQQKRVTGMRFRDAGQRERLARILGEYGQQTSQLVHTLLSPYAGGLRQDFTSFRPVEEKNRKMRLRARNDLLHVDSFPTRPVFGNRILRIFENINPAESRFWHTGETFDVLAARFWKSQSPPGHLHKTRRGWLPAWLGRRFGLKTVSHSPYDRWMMRFHNFLKENTDFQQNTKKTAWEFPPGSAWLVYTDMVSHAVIAGRFALEQTFIVSRCHMALPDRTPIAILKQLYGQGVHNSRS